MSAARARGITRAIALAAIGAGCASGPGLRGGVYRDPGQEWTIAAPPAAWRRIAVEDTDLAFVGPAEASIALTSRCGGVSGTPAVLARQLRAGLGAHDVVEERAIDLAGQPAQRQILALERARVATVTRASPPCVQDFVLVAARDFDAALAVFDAWWASFAPAAEAAR